MDSFMNVFPCRESHIPAHLGVRRTLPSNPACGDSRLLHGEVVEDEAFAVVAISHVPALKYGAFPL